MSDAESKLYDIQVAWAKKVLSAQDWEKQALWDSINEIRQLYRSVLEEYKDTHLGYEGMRILNNLYERFGKL